MNERLEIANTILSQMGGAGRLKVMTGAKNFVALESGVQFSLPGGGGFCKNGINKVKIELMPSDTYTVSFYRIRGTKVTELGVHTDVYNEDLVELFENETGLRTRL